MGCAMANEGHLYSNVSRPFLPLVGLTGPKRPVARKYACLVRYHVAHARERTYTHTFALVPNARFVQQQTQVGTPTVGVRRALPYILRTCTYACHVCACYVRAEAVCEPDLAEKGRLAPRVFQRDTKVRCGTGPNFTIMFLRAPHVCTRMHTHTRTRTYIYTPGVIKPGNI